MSLSSLSSDIEQALIDSNVDKVIANITATQVSEKITHKYGGFNLYIPKGKKQKSECKRKQIILDFDGSNQNQLAKKYDFSLQHIYRILKEHANAGTELTT